MSTEPDTGRESLTTISPAQVREDPPGPGRAPWSAGPSAPWLPLVGAIGGVAGATAIVYAVGGAVMLMRLNAAGVEANEALGAIPQQTLFAVGAEQLILPALLAAFVYGLFFLVDRRRRRAGGGADETQEGEVESVPLARAPVSVEDPTETDQEGRIAALWRRVALIWRSPITRAARRVIGWILIPIRLPLRWYFHFVPDLLIAWLPILLFLPNPAQNVIAALNATPSRRGSSTGPRKARGRGASSRSVRRSPWPR